MIICSELLLATGSGENNIVYSIYHNGPKQLRTKQRLPGK